MELIKKKSEVMIPLAELMLQVAEEIKCCTNCGNLDIANPCLICSNADRDKLVICIVEEIADLWAIERTGSFKGTYHVLGGTLSAIDGRGPEALGLERLIQRVKADGVKEIILATNSTIDGQITAHYITQSLHDSSVTVSKIAQGIPIGGELDYLDEGTLGTAMKMRRTA